MTTRTVSAASNDEASPRDLSPLILQMMDLLKRKESLKREARRRGRRRHPRGGNAERTAAVEAEAFAAWIASRR